MSKNRQQPKVTNKIVDNRRSETLCWTCFKSCRIRGKTCSWAESFVPVEGWTAEKGTVAYHLADPLIPGSSSSHSYTVFQCPLYEERTAFLDYGDVVRTIVNKYKISTTRFYRNSEKYMTKYEKETGRSIPIWARAEHRLKNNT